MLKRYLPLLVLLYTIAIIIISLIPIPNLPLPEFNLLQPDKLFHFLMYFVMFLGWKKSNFFKEDKYFIKSLVIVFLVGLFTEFLQGTEYIERYYELADLLANSIGILFSYLIFVLYPFKKKHA
ncbi:VanZ family protein [Flavobacteriaceae bacterium]|nr:VanZ family protein [Flavobacteriaceae bacterium]MBT7683379.1 VanZ family protein [Cryomorphaceae bacterium]MDB4147798.1 VanZ family protein [bacterium]MDA7708368.1 VanZ family protein [Flavobacteriaceae bacterium]MDA8733798.1 VanZ family protein [Flavobacteriaceae bacterium]